MINLKKVALPLLAIGISLISFNCFANVQSKVTWHNIPTTVTVHYSVKEAQTDTTYTEYDLDDPSKQQWMAWRTLPEQPTLLKMLSINTYTNISATCQPDEDPMKPPHCARFVECDNFQAVHSMARYVFIDLFLTDIDHGYCSVRWI